MSAAQYCGFRLLILKVRTGIDGRHESLSLELAADTGIDTLWPPPCLLDGDKAIGLVTLELVGLLLDDGRAGEWDSHGALQLQRSMAQRTNKFPPPGLEV